MTRKEAIKELQESHDTMRSYDVDENESRLMQALNMAIQSLSQEGGYCCRTCKHTRINKDGIWCEEPTCQWEQAVTNSEAQEPCDDLISRKAVDKYIARLLSGYLYDGERERLEIFSAYLWELPSVTQKPKTGHWIEHPEIETSAPEYLMFYECSECGDRQCFCKSDIHKKRFCSNCGCRMVEPQESEDKAE